LQNVFLPTSPYSPSSSGAGIIGPTVVCVLSLTKTQRYIPTTEVQIFPINYKGCLVCPQGAHKGKGDGNGK
jgi:hypothetical protein